MTGPGEDAGGAGDVAKVPAARGGARRPRPWLERIGLAAIALVLGLLFGGVAVASWVGGEIFLAAMAGIGCLMTFWVGGLTLVRG